MAPTTTTTLHARYPSTEVMERQQYAVHKHRKQVSTGGGRAWSEDEEVYLLQTRLQKMPYKHIAAHLKKTELACRLHYHQLSHGNNRRRRASSFSSDSSVQSDSPLLSTLPYAHSMPSPIHEDAVARSSRSPSAPIQLPAASTLLCHAPPVAILPKPAHARHALPETNIALTMPSAQLPTSHRVNHMSVDMGRLRQIYEGHRDSFWSAVAAEYGPGADRYTLEEAWRSASQGPSVPACAPPSPCVSPDSFARGASLPGKPLYPARPAPATTPSPRLSPAARPEPSAHRTSISSLLGIDANPRSPEEREMIRRLEERRGSRMSAANA